MLCPGMTYNTAHRLTPIRHHRARYMKHHSYRVHCLDPKHFSTSEKRPPLWSPTFSFLRSPSEKTQIRMRSKLACRCILMLATLQSVLANPIPRPLPFEMKLVARQCYVACDYTNCPTGYPTGTVNVGTFRLLLTLLESSCMKLTLGSRDAYHAASEAGEGKLGMYERSN